jgi:D-alanine-D-alanine ligase
MPATDAAPTPSRIHLVVLFGGQSAEHDVSCVTARHVLAAVDPGRYEVDAVGITRQGDWVRAEAALELLARGVEHLPDALEPVGPGHDLLPALAAVRDEGRPVVVLPLLHGPYGEDGTVQGLLELAGVPYVGTGVLGSAVAMDKTIAKELTARAGIAQVRHRSLHESEISPALVGELIDELGLPLFVKPANLGSSIGISKVRDAAGLDAALALAAEYDEWLVVEEAVVAREIEFAVLGSIDPRVSVPGEIRPGGDFYDYADKYLDGAAELLVPADLPEAVAAEGRELAGAAFRALRCDGMARVDFLYEQDGRGWLLNEVNTIPGFTPISMYPRLWEASGISYPDLVDALVALAFERFARRRRRTDH